MKDRARRSSEKGIEKEENDKQSLRMPNPEEMKEIEKKEEQSLKVTASPVLSVHSVLLRFPPVVLGQNFKSTVTTKCTLLCTPQVYLVVQQVLSYLCLEVLKPQLTQTFCSTESQCT